jgi:hypothetical protein
MGRCRVVAPLTTRIDISDGDWLEVKKRLPHGDVRDRIIALTGADRGDGTSSINLEMVGLADILAWVVDWSLVDAQGAKLPIEISAIRQLDEDSYDEIVDAVGVHAALMKAEQDAEKKSRGGVRTSNSTSTSAA